MTTSDIGRTTDLFVDGGCIRANPSTIGATWAARYIARLPDVTSPELGEVVHEVAGVLACSARFPSVGRLGSGFALHSVPAWLSRRCRAALRRLDLQAVQWVLLAGHPTVEELAKGRARHGGRVSQHNKWCDRAARKAGAAYLAQVTS